MKVEDCYIAGDQLLDMAVGVTPDGSYLFTFKGESTDPPITLTLTPAATSWLTDRILETRALADSARAMKRKRR